MAFPTVIYWHIDFPSCWEDIFWDFNKTKKPEHNQIRSYGLCLFVKQSIWVNRQKIKQRKYSTLLFKLFCQRHLFAFDNCARFYSFFGEQSWAYGQLLPSESKQYQHHNKNANLTLNRSLATGQVNWNWNKTLKETTYLIWWDIARIFKNCRTTKTTTEYTH